MKREELRKFVEEICQTKKDMLELNNEELRIYKMSFYGYNYDIYELNTIWDYLWDYIPKQEMYRRLKLKWTDNDMEIANEPKKDD